MPKRDEKRDHPRLSPSRSARTMTSARRSPTTRSPICPEAEDGDGKTAGADGGERDPDGEGAIALLDPDEAAARLGAGRRAGLSTVRDGVGRFLAEARATSGCPSRRSARWASRRASAAT